MPRSIERSQRRSRACGFPYDAILVDEGQDFELDWWNLLRKQVRPDGEMLLVSDPTQNIYGQDSWTDEAHMLGAGFSGPVDRPRRFIPPPTRHGQHNPNVRTRSSSMGRSSDRPSARPRGALRSSTDRPNGDGRTFGRPARHPGCGRASFAHQLASRCDGLDPSEIVVLCETHDQGLLAVRQLEQLGHDVHHIFAKDDEERRRRKQRFWPDAPGIKACTIHSFKGWESRAVVLCIGNRRDSARLAYVAMTRLQADPNGRPSDTSGSSTQTQASTTSEIRSRTGSRFPSPDAGHKGRVIAAGSSARDTALT